MPKPGFYGSLTEISTILFSKQIKRPISFDRRAHFLCQQVAPMAKHQKKQATILQINPSSNESQHCSMINQRRWEMFTSRQRQSYQLPFFNAFFMEQPLRRRCTFPTRKTRRLQRLIKTLGTRATRRCQRHHAASWASSVIVPTRGLACLGCSMTSINPYELPKKIPSPAKNWRNNWAQPNSWSERA